MTPLLVLKRILPWHLRRSLPWLRFYYARRKPPFEGVYADFSAVPAGAGWSAKRWTESSRVHAQKERGRIGAALPENPQPSKSLLALLCAAEPGYGRRSVRILDFGGAGGVDYARLLGLLGAPSGDVVRYHVVDVPESCAAGREVWADDPRISFGDLPGPSERFDIVYADGALHMVEDFGSLLARFAAYEPSCMLFCKVSLHEGPSFVRRQVNMGREMENAQWVLGFADLVAAAKAVGYRLTYRAYGEDSYNVDNYSPPHQAGRTAHLLFRREAPRA